MGALLNAQFFYKPKNTLKNCGFFVPSQSVKKVFILKKWYSIESLRFHVREHLTCIFDSITKIVNGLKIACSL